VSGETRGAPAPTPVRIRSLRVDGFGIHRGLALGPLSPAVQVIAGPNEAGKSTLLAFLRWMLFAPWAGRGVNPPLPPLRGGDAGGELELDGPGGSWRLAKRVAGSRRDFRLVRPDGTEGDAADLAALLGGTTLDLFERVFFFDLADMAEIGRLGGESLEGRLLAAGLTGAGAGARELAKELADRARELAAPRGDCRLKRLLERRAELAARLGDLRAAARAAADRGEERALAREIADLEEERKQLVARREFLGAVAGLAEVRGPADDLRRERAALVLDDRLDALAAEAEGLAREESAARAARDEALDLEPRRARAAARAAELLAALGDGWDAGRLRALPPADLLRGEGLRRSRAREEARERLREARTAAEAARERERVVLEGAPRAGPALLEWVSWPVAVLAVLAGTWLVAGAGERLAGALALLVAAIAAAAGLGLAWRRRAAGREETARREAAARERQGAEEAVRRAEEDVREADAAWDAFLGEHGLPAVDGVDGLLAFLDRAREARAALAEAARIEADLAARRERVARWCAATARLLARADAGVDVEEADPFPALSAALVTLRERIAADREARERAREIDARLRELERQEERLLAGRDRAAVERELAEGDADARRAELEAIEARLREIDEMAGERHRRLGGLEAERRRLEGDADLPALEQELRAVEADLAETVAAWQRLALGEALAREALRRFRERHQPAVLRRASEWLARMTGGRHPAVRPREDGEGLEIAGRAGEALAPDRLSRGTREQLWLALRLALAVDVARRGPAPPLVLDDVLVDFDPERRAAAARVLAAVGRELQVLVLTCHPDLASLLAREAGASVTELPPVFP